MTKQLGIRICSSTIINQGIACLAGLLLAGGLAGCKSSSAAVPQEKPLPPEVLQTESSIKGEELSYTVDGQSHKGYLAYDSQLKGKRPGVLVVHEWWGHNDYARKRAEMLAKLGYVALALDMYGEGQTAGHPEDATKFMKALMKEPKLVAKRFEKGLSLLKESEHTNPEQVAAIGYCMGGGIVLNMARMGMELDGVVSFHGGLEAMSPAKKDGVNARVLVLHGEADPFISPEQKEAFIKEFDRAKVDYRLVEYPGAKHAFTNPGATDMGEKFSLPLEYNEDADQASWAEMKSFLADAFSG